MHRPKRVDDASLCRDAAMVASGVAQRMLTAWDPLRFGWDWGTGLAGHALLQWHATHPCQNVTRFLKQWIDHHLAHNTSIHDKGGRLWKIGPGTCVLYFWQQSGELRYRTRLEDLLAYIDASPRWHDRGSTGDGILLSKEERAEIWVDSLMTLCPFLARMDGAGLAPGALEEAEKQLCLHADLLRHPHSGLWYHAFDLKSTQPMGQLWSRGLGWALFGMVEVLAPMSPARRAESPLGLLLADSLKAAMAVADQQGAWHTVMDHPASPAETSGQAMILYALAVAWQADLLPAALRSNARDALIRGWGALSANVGPDGTIHGVTGGTSAGSYEHYLDRKTTGWLPWGDASVLLAATAISRMHVVTAGL